MNKLYKISDIVKATDPLDGDYFIFGEILEIEITGETPYFLVGSSWHESYRIEKAPEEVIKLFKNHI
ncbi:hypothetical protein [Myroides odoratus]|uniref:hypothetical protein n=1 Tax=Myroides odoratus TaxID=256 RepID=UPI0039B04DE7